METERFRAKTLLEFFRALLRDSEKPCEDPYSPSPFSPSPP